MADNNNLIKFLLKGINTEQFAVIEKNFKEGDEVKISSALKVLANDEIRMIGVFVKIDFLQNDKSFIILENAGHFEISEESWPSVYNPETKVVTLPKGFSIHIAATVIGIARGYLLAKVEKIPSMRKIFVPLLDATKFIPSDLELKP